MRQRHREAEPGRARLKDWKKEEELKGQRQRDTERKFRERDRTTEEEREAVTNRQ